MRQTGFSVVNRLGALLQSVDNCKACKISCDGTVGGTLRIVVVPQWQKNLLHVKTAISGDTELMQELGIDLRNIEICGEQIYIAVPVREEDPRAA